MKIRNKLPLSIFIIAFLFALLGFVEYQYFKRVEKSFQMMDQHIIPSVNSLLETISTARRASIKAVEYSLRGEPGDRVKALEALQQLEQHFDHYIQIKGVHNDSDSGTPLSEFKDRFVGEIKNYLLISEGPALNQVFSEQKKLHRARSHLNNSIDNLMQQDADIPEYQLLLLKSEARKVSIKLLEYILRGIQQDRQKGLEAINTLLETQQNHVQESTSHPQLMLSVTQALDAYIQAARDFLELMSSRKHPLEAINLSEEAVHQSRKLLIQTLYPKIDLHYQMQHTITQRTSSQLQWSSRLQLYSILLITFIAAVTGVRMARSITNPLRSLTQASGQIALGNLNTPLPSPTEDEVGELTQSFKQMVEDLKNQRIELKQADELYREAQQVAQLGNWNLDLGSGIAYWSEEEYRLLGYQPGEVESSAENFMQAIHPDDREKVQKEMERAMNPHEQEPYHIEHRVKYRDGEIRHVDQRGHVDFDENGKPLRMYGTTLDITERKRAEQAMQFSHQQHEEAQKLARLGHWQLDLTSNHLFWSSEVFRIFDIDPKKFGASYEAFLDAIHPEDRERVNSAYSNSLKDHKPYEIVHRLLMKDGSIKHVIEKCETEFAKDGSPLMSIGTIQDITEQVLIEQELEQYKQHLEKLVQKRTAEIKNQASIIEQTHDSVVTTDSKDIILSWNGGAERLFQIPASAAIGQHISIIYPDKYHNRLREQVISTLQKKHRYESEVMMKRGDGSEFPARLSLSMLFDEEEKANGMISFSADLTELKQHEQELAQLSRQLQNSNKELEAFSYSVSHDLRSPLRSIDGFSLALVEDYGDQLDETARDYLSRVRKAAQRMAQLIDDLLQLSRVNRLELHEQTVDLKQLAQETFKELREQEPERQIKLKTGSHLLAQGDERLLKMVIDNLVGNAWKFTAQQKKAQITLKTMADNPAVFYIKDNGVGFDMRHAGKLFGVFQRLHQVKEFPGTGVGLATVQRIIHRHGGQIWAEAEPGKGAIFFFTLAPNAGLETR